MQDDGIFDGFLKVIKNKPIDKVIGAINIDEKTKAMGDFLDEYVIGPIGKLLSRKNTPTEEEKLSKVLDLSGIGQNIFDFADMGSFESVISRLKELALYEKWDLAIEPENSIQRNIILKDYILFTFGKLADSKQVVVDEHKTIAIFNTGLVNRHYEPIYALFKKNDNKSRKKWKFIDFFVVGEGLGKRVLDEINAKDLPLAPRYINDPCDLIYDTCKGKPSPDYNHCIIDNIHRWPDSVHEHEAPLEWAKVKNQISPDMPDKDRSECFKKFRVYLNKNDKVLRSYRTRFNEAIELAVKKVSWNYKTAIPMYWPTNKKIQLLLPLCLDSEERVDVALVVNKAKNGYIGDTILTLDMAYTKARLVCKPDSDWLIAVE